MTRRLPSYIFILLLALPLSGVGQLTLEHRYPEQAVTLLDLEHQGPVYFMNDWRNKEIRLYHPDHSLWKTIPVQLTGTSFYRVHDVSQERYQAGEGIEYVLSYFTPGFQESPYQIWNDQGEILLDPGDGHSYSTFEIDGVPKVLFNGFTHTNGWGNFLYNRDDYSLEGYVWANLEYINLPYSGEKLQWINTAGASPVVEIYNPDLSLYKQIPLPAFNSGYFHHYGGLTERLVDGTPQLFIHYSTRFNGSYSGVVINEQAEALLTVPGASQVLRVTYGNVDWIQVDFREDSSVLVDPMTMEMVHSFPNGRASWSPLAGDFELFSSFNQEEQTVEVFGANYEKIATYTHPEIEEYYKRVQSITPSRRIFNFGEAIEYWVEIENGQNADVVDLIVVDENGTTFLEMVDLRHWEVVEVGNDHKLLVTRLNGDSEVYHIDRKPDATAPLATDHGIHVFPNPAQRAVEVWFEQPDAINQLQIHNMQGQLVSSIPLTSTLHRMELPALAKGTYQLVFTGPDLRESQLLVVQ